MTLAELIRWHTEQGIAAMNRAASAHSKDCKSANERAETSHREAVELLATFTGTYPGDVQPGRNSGREIIGARCSEGDKTTYEVCLAFDIACYATITVTAEDEDEAVKLAVEEARDVSFQPEWDSAHSNTHPGDSDHISEAYRLVDINEADPD